MPTIDEELVANSASKFNGEVTFANKKNNYLVSIFDNYEIDNLNNNYIIHFVNNTSGQFLDYRTYTYKFHSLTRQYTYISFGDKNNNVSIGKIYTGSTLKYGIFTDVGNDVGIFLNSSYDSTTGYGYISATYSSSGWISTKHLYFRSKKSTDYVATLDDISLKELTLSKGSTNIFTSLLTFTAKQHYICSFTLSSMTYTFNFDLDNNSTTCFNVIYGTTSNDIATCKAYVTNGTLSIDLDNVPSTINTLNCSYYAYN